MIKNSFKLLLFLIIAIYFFISFYKVASTSAPDFSVFYYSCRSLINNENIYKNPLLYTGFGYPPVTLALFVPLCIFSYQSSQFLFNIINFASFIGVCLLTLKLVKKKILFSDFLWIFIFGFLSFPVRFTLGMGQVNLISLLLFLSGLVLISTAEINFRSAVFFCLSVLIKPHLLILFPFFFFTKARKEIITSLILVFFITLIFIFFFGLNNFVVYFQDTLPPLIKFTGRDIYYNQSISAFTSRIMNLNLAFFLTNLTSFALVIISFFIVIKKRLSLVAIFAISVPLYLLIEPLSWQHHFVFLMPVFVYLYHYYQRSLPATALLAICYLLISFNLKTPNAIDSVFFKPFLLSHVFIGNAGVYVLSLTSIIRRI